MRMLGWRSVFVMVLGAGLLAWASLGCNAVLGIDQASLEAADGGGDDASEPITCARYCDLMMQNCTGPNAEYLTRDSCTTMCADFEGSTAIVDSADDTIGCRLFHAMRAATTPKADCQPAGPLGGGVCGTDPCRAFCKLDLDFCSGLDPAHPAAYATTQDCVQDCEPSAAATPSPASTGYPYLLEPDAGDTALPDGTQIESGDTLNCRLWHLETAEIGGDSKVHCPHTALVSTVCF